VKVLVYPHTMGIGGSQLNAIEIAGAVRDRGHDVTVVSRPGPLVETVRQLGLPHITLESRRTVSPRAITDLTSLARKHGADVVHGYEWPPGVEAFLGPRLRLGTAVVCTVMSERVAPFLPRTVPLIVGRDEVRHRALAAGRPMVTLIEPPVDVRANSPEYDPGPFRAELGLDAAAPLVAIVGRLAATKLDGVLCACDVVGELVHSGVDVQLVLVGDGESRPQVEEAAAAANARAGRRVVALAGEMYDPRPAYAAADVVLGTGGSALRGMAFGKPLVVQGDRDFWKLVTPETAPEFLSVGWGGFGSDDPDWRAAGTARLSGILRPLLDDPAARTRLGEFGRALVVERFSLDHAAAIQEEVYLSATDKASRPAAVRLAMDAARTGSGTFWHKARRRWQRWRGTVVVEDFNMSDPRARRGAR